MLSSCWVTAASSSLSPSTRWTTTSGSLRSLSCSSSPGSSYCCSAVAEGRLPGSLSCNLFQPLTAPSSFLALGSPPPAAAASSSILVPQTNTQSELPESSASFKPLLPLSGDTTVYERFGDGPQHWGIETSLAPGCGNKPILHVPFSAITALTKEAFRRVNHLYRSSHLQQLADALRDPEASDNDRFVCLDLLKNACISAGMVLPMCQDTGTAIVMAHKGQRVWTPEPDGLMSLVSSGAVLSDVEAVNRGVMGAYVGSAFRYSQMAPLSMFSEKNTKTNLPAQVDIEACSGDEYEFLFLAKGGGSANKTFLFQKTQSVLNPQALKAFVKENLMTLGTSACPPYHISLVVGGTSPEANLKTVKLASTRYLDDLPRSGSMKGHGYRDIEFEKEVLKICQEGGIGAQFGGKYFALDARVIRLPRHGASCFIGLGVSCSADRQMKGKITKDGLFLEKLETDPAKYLPDDMLEAKILDTKKVSINLNKPMKETLAELSKLKIGQRVSLTGSMIVARDIAHSRLKERLDKTGELPSYMKDHFIYYAGPAKTPSGMASGSFGPTTAARMDPYVPLFMSKGASLVTLAKGNRSKAVAEACKKYGGFYLASIGGPAAKLANDCIKSVQVLEYEDLGMEAVWKIDVKDFPAFVIVDDKGQDFFSLF